MAPHLRDLKETHFQSTMDHLMVKAKNTDEWGFVMSGTGVRKEKKDKKKKKISKREKEWRARREKNLRKVSFAEESRGEEEEERDFAVGMDDAPTYASSPFLLNLFLFSIVLVFASVS